MFAANVVELIFGQEAAGSGYLITPRHVLTARHLVRPAAVGTLCLVQPLLLARDRDGPLSNQTRPGARPGKASWLSDSHDLAIIELDSALEERPAQRIKFGRVRGDDLEPYPCRGAGFPAAADRFNKIVLGSLVYVPGAKHFDLTVENAVPRNWEDWAGLSGALMFCGDLAVGVVRTVDSNWDRSLTATPVQHLIEDDGFKSYWTKQGEELPVAYELTSIDTDDTLQSLNEAARHSQLTSSAFLFLSIGTMLITYAIPDSFLFIGAINLPISQWRIPVAAFAFTTPLVYLLCHTLILLNLLILSRKFGSFYSSAHTASLSKSERGRFMEKVHSFIFLRMLSADEDVTFVEFFAGTIIILTTVFLPVVVLLTALLRFLCIHNHVITNYHRSLILLDAIVIFMFWPRILSIGNFACSKAASRWNPLRYSLIQYYSILCLLPFVLIGSAFPGEWLDGYAARVIRGAPLLSSALRSDPSKPFAIFNTFLVPKFEPGEFRLEAKFTTERDFVGAVFDGLDLSGFDLSGSDLHGASLVRTILREAILSRANLQNTHLDLAEMQGANLYQAQLQGASFVGSQVQGANLSQAWMQGANLLQTQLQAADLSGTHLQGASLRYVQLQGAILDYCNMSGIRIMRSDLSGASLRGCDLQGANISVAAAKGASLLGIKVWRAYVSGDDLDNFRDVLKSAKIEGVKLNADSPFVFVTEPLGSESHKDDLVYQRFVADAVFGVLDQEVRDVIIDRLSMLTEDPLSGIPGPKTPEQVDAANRDVWVRYEAASARGPRFDDSLLEVLRETACRPNKISSIESKAATELIHFYEIWIDRIFVDSYHGAPFVAEIIVGRLKDVGSLAFSLSQTLSDEACLGSAQISDDAKAILRSIGEGSG